MTKQEPVCGLDNAHKLTRFPEPYLCYVCGRNVCADCTGWIYVYPIDRSRCVRCAAIGKPYLMRINAAALEADKIQKQAYQEWKDESLKKVEESA